MSLQSRATEEQRAELAKAIKIPEFKLLCDTLNVIYQRPEMQELLHQSSNKTERAYSIDQTIAELSKPPKMAIAGIYLFAFYILSMTFWAIHLQISERNRVVPKNVKNSKDDNPQPKDTSHYIIIYPPHDNNY